MAQHPLLSMLLKFPKGRLIGAAILTAVCVAAGYQLLTPLAADPLWQRWSIRDFLAPALLLLISHLLRALRLAAELSLTLRQAWPLLAWHTFAVNLLPMRSGELTLPLLLHRRCHIGLARAAATLVWLRFQDLLVLAGITLWLLPLGPWWMNALLCGLFAAIVANARRLLCCAAPLVQKPKAVARFVAGLQQAAEASHGVWHWTIANWCVKIAALALFLALFLERSLAEAKLWQAVLAGEWAAIQPVQGVAGVGPYEAAVALTLQMANIPLEVGVAAALMLHLLFFSVSALLALLASLQR